MIELVAIRVDRDPGGPTKRFGLYTIGEDGGPHTFHGHFDTPREILLNCAGIEDAFVVEVANYAFLRIRDFSNLFGPIPSATVQHTD